MATPRVARIRAEVEACTDVDAVARVVLGALLELPDVVRAGIALVALGGRQLHFLPSDPDRLRSEPEWCLIDAYDDLPLNDCVRTGRPVVHGSPESLAEAYPDLAEAQAETGTRSVYAVPVGRAGDVLGGLLVYRDVPDVGDGAFPAVAAELAEVAAEALAAVRPPAQWPEEQGLVSAEEDAASACLLPPDARAPAVARRWLVDALAELGEPGELPSGVLDAALVCTSELVTNVVMHAGRPSVATLEHDTGRLTVRLRHLTGPRARKVVRAGHDPLPISGHGLRLVAALCDAWGTHEADGVTTVWCTFALPGSRAD